MSDKDEELLLRAVLDELNEGEEDQLRELLTRSPSAGAELEEVRRMASALASTPDASFEPFFPTRVMHRIESEAGNEGSVLIEIMAMQFMRVAPAALAAAMALFVFNVVSGRQEFDTPLEAGLGLPSVTVEAAFDYDFSYYAAAVADPNGEG